MASNTTSNMSLRSILEKDKLNRTNFLDWYKNLRIVLKQEGKEYILDQPIPDEPAANTPKAQRMLIVSSLMILLMSLVSCLDVCIQIFKSNLWRWMLIP